jgi:acetyl esterase/lipase
MISFSRRTALKGAAAASLVPLLPRGRALAQATFEESKNVPYGTADGQELTVDIYQPPLRETPRPAVVLIHGGAWVTGQPNDMDWPASELAKEGYVCFSIGYRLLDTTNVEHPNHWPAQLDDVQRAVRWVRANAAAYGVDPERMGAIGHSAGGQLAAFLGTRDTNDNSIPELAEYSSRVSCVVALAGDYDLAVPYINPNEGAITVKLLGGTPEEVPDAYRDASPFAFVDEQSSPFLLLASGRDEPRPIEQTWLMAEKLRDAGVEVVAAHIPDADHFEIVNWTVSGVLISAFMGEHLDPQR